MWLAFAKVFDHHLEFAVAVPFVDVDGEDHVDLIAGVEILAPVFGVTVGVAEAKADGFADEVGMVL